MTLLQTIDFPVNLDETEPQLKYPYLNGQRYNFRLIIEDAVYIGTISYNIWENSPQISITTDGEIPILANIIMRPAITLNAPNLIPSLIFRKYRLLWNLKKGLLFYSLD